MKKFLLLGLMLLGFLGVKAEKLHLTFGAEWYCTASWNGNTFTWGSGGIGNPDWTFINITNVNGDVSKYTKLYFKLTDFNNSVDNKLTLYFKENKGNTQSMDYVAKIEITPNDNGEFEFDLMNFDWKNNQTPSETIDKTNIYDVTLYGGARIDGNQDGSVKIVEAYLEKPDDPFVSIEASGFGDEITSLNDITDGTPFVIGQETNVMYWITSSVDAQKGNFKNVPNDSYYFFILENVAGLDLDENGEEDVDNYRIRIVNASGDNFKHAWNFGYYLNYSMYGHLFAASCKSTAEGSSKEYGWDGDYYAIWKVVYSEGDGFFLKNVGCGKYATLGGTSNAVTYLKFYKSIEYTNTTIYPADDQIFALSNATGYDTEIGIGNNMGWSFDTPVDLSNWKYLVIGLANTAANGSHKITIKDNTGKSVGGDDYKGEEAKTGAGMWFDYWNSQNIIAVSTEQLSIANGLDIHNITSLSIEGEVKPTVAYLTSYANTKLVNRGRWTLYVDGDLKREYTTETLGKFGTICLPYKASYAGAEIYSIASANSSSITLSKVTGLLEAGKPYFYLAVDEVGQDNGNAGKNVHNVNFFRADFDRYDVATPSTNNGLIGTFVDGTVPQGPNYYVVGRAAGDTEDKIFQVDSEVSLPANRAYIDKSMIADIAVSSRTLLLGFDGEENEATAIESTEVVDVVTDAVFYDMSGREVKNPTPGIYIVKYGNKTKKVMIK